MPISPARVAAFEILLRAANTDAYASELLHSSLAARLSLADHGLATEIVMGVLRWRSVLDEHTATHASQPLAKLDAEVITALRIGTYQLLFLDRIPAHAAINESVELVKKARKRSAAGMVNAILRKIAPVRGGPASQTPSFLSSRARPDLSLAEDQAESRDPQLTAVHRPESEWGPIARHMALKAHPDWLVKGWESNLGTAAAHSICAYDQHTPDTVIRAGVIVLTEVEQEGITLEPGKLVSGAYRITRGDITRTQAFREKRLVIQDEGSQLVALLLGRGLRILDCCAAPGGKTRILAEQNPQSNVIAMELHPHRAALMKRLVPLPNVHVVAADARQMPFSTQFDRILVDAPCTGTGTLARNPDIKWRLKAEDIERLQSYQIQILLAAINHLSPGGHLLYSTCSLEPEENEAVIEQVLREQQGLQILSIRDRLNELREQGTLLYADLDSLVRGRYLRTIPGVHLCDGFFAALLQREM